jgi:hypothetical protein
MFMPGALLSHQNTVDLRNMRDVRNTERSAWFSAQGAGWAGILMLGVALSRGLQVYVVHIVACHVFDVTRLYEWWLGSGSTR